MKELDITQAKARKIIKQICEHFNVSQCKVWFIDIDDPKTIGWYEPLSENMYAYMMIEKKWSRRLILVLHEITHHIQEEIYNIKSPHGKEFQLARSRVATWVRNNISKNFDWESMLSKDTIGKMKCKKRKK
jgi:hypothetical protein